MKSVVKKILAVVMIGGAMVGLASCKSNNNNNNPSSNITPPQGNVCYYGCPNSNKVKKLNTKKRG